MKSQGLHTAWCNSSDETAGEIWSWSLLGVKGFYWLMHLLASVRTCGVSLLVCVCGFQSVIADRFSKLEWEEDSTCDVTSTRGIMRGRQTSARWSVVGILSNLLHGVSSMIQTNRSNQSNVFFIYDVLSSRAGGVMYSRWALFKCMYH